VKGLCDGDELAYDASLALACIGLRRVGGKAVGGPKAISRIGECRPSFTPFFIFVPHARIHARTLTHPHTSPIFTSVWTVLESMLLPSGHGVSSVNKNERNSELLWGAFRGSVEACDACAFANLSLCLETSQGWLTRERGSDLT